MKDRASILVIDDTSDALALMNQVLTSADYQVRLADSGELALAAVAADRPDLILLDVEMQGISGFEVCRRLKGQDRTRHIPIILVSGTGGPEDVVEGLRLGAADYVLKPFRPEEILARVNTHLSLSRAILALDQQASALRLSNEGLQFETVERRRVEGELRQSLERAERDRRAMLSTLEDQRRAETALRESEKRLTDVMFSAADWVWETDAHGVFTFTSEKGIDYFGQSREDIIGKTPFDFMAPDEAKRVGAIFADIAARKAPIKDLENWNVHRSGERMCLLTNGVPILDEAGTLTGYRGVDKDVTAWKVAGEEKAKLVAQLQQAQKMESVGRLAGGVAHDFNNMLGVILGHAELALAQVDPAQPLHADLQQIRAAANRSADLTRQLLAFARKQTVMPKVLDLNDAVAGMLSMLRRLIGENVDVTLQPAADLWSVRMDPSQIDQILANLCVNARDAISEGGTLMIETQNMTLDERDCAANVGCAPGEYVRLAVSDTGCGMDPDTLSHLFEPFFTTKEVGKGTGLGLATVYGIVRQNGGFIDVYSEPNLGTTFNMYLPRHVAKAAQTRAEGGASPAPGGEETILLVEDEPTILRLTKTMLERQGYIVLAASTPGEAMHLAQAYAGEIHLLLTDVVMPEMNGRVLAKNVLSLYPQIKRLFMSGYTADVIAHHGVLDEGVPFIQKPFSMQDLATKVRGALDT